MPPVTETKNSFPAPELELLFEVEQKYRTLMSLASPLSNAEPSLGGRLLYAGELTANRALVIAANIAGAASLSATSDPAMQRQAIRESIADFVVNSLDEALRILKNQIRKREAVAVCIAQLPAAIEQEMAGRGVKPDLLALQIVPPERDGIRLCWSVKEAPALWMPKIDTVVQACLQDAASHRWLRLAPRSMGRLARNLRLIACSEETAAKLIAVLEEKRRSGEITVEINLFLYQKTRN